MKHKSTIEAYKGLTFAKASEKLAKKYKNKETDATEKAAYEAELDALLKHQTNVRMATQMEESLKQFKNGGTLPKYFGGTDPNGLPSVPPGTDPWAGSYPDSVPAGNDPWSGSTSLDTSLKSLPQLKLAPMYPQFDENNVPSDIAMKNKALEISNRMANPSNYQVSNEGNFSTLSDAPKTTGKGSAYTPALIGQGISTALNAAILAGGYDKVAPVDNPYESQIKQLMGDRNIDTTQQRNQILSQYNAAKANIGNARSANVQQALNTNLMNVTQDSLAQSKLQEQQLNNQYKADYAQTLGNLGQQRVAATNLSQALTARNKGQLQSNVSAFGANVAENTKFFTTSKLNDIQNKMMGDILNSKYSDVGLNKDVITRLNQGKVTPEDILVLKNAYGEEAANIIIEKFKG